MGVGVGEGVEVGAVVGCSVGIGVDVGMGLLSPGEETFKLHEELLVEPSRAQLLSASEPE